MAALQQAAAVAGACGRGTEAHLLLQIRAMQKWVVGSGGGGMARGGQGGTQGCVRTHNEWRLGAWRPG